MSGRRAVYSISVVAEITGFHQQTIRQYERMGLLQPERTPGGTRRYTQQDVERLQAIAVLTQQMGVNLAGVELILRLREREAQLIKLARELFSQLDPAARARFESVMRGNEAGLVPVGEQGLAVARPAGPVAGPAETAKEPEIQAEHSRRRIPIQGE
ncbi:MerR family transcriptional regulator [bacterium]|nr:MerR family transcriptional regulator [bacterium]